LAEKLTGVDSHVEIVLLIYWLKILKEMWLKTDPFTLVGMVTWLRAWRSGI